MLGPFVAEANPRHDAGIEAVAEEGCQSQNGEDQFNHVFFAALERLIKSRSLDFGMRKTPRFFFETFRGLVAAKAINRC